MGQHLARSACIYALAERRKDEKSYDNLAELRKRQEIELGNGELTYILIDEESKININTASSEVIKALLRITADLSEVSAQEVAEAIVNGRTEQLFRVKEEILNIEGVKEEIFDACKDFITVYGKGEVNINTAAPEVLAALGLEEGLVGIIKDFRLGADGKEDTEDDGYFKNTTEIIDKLRAFRMLTEKQESDLLDMLGSGLINVKSSNFSLQIETKILGKPGMKYKVVVDSKDKIREWGEY
jgi:hypothetical protein